MSAATASRVGFSRVSGPVARLFDEAAANARDAAASLAELSSAADRAGLIDAITRFEGEGDRIAHDLQREVARRLTLPFDRGSGLRLVAALDDVVDAIDEAAHAFPIGGDALPRDGVRLLVGILRDLVRVTMGAVRELEAPSEVRMRRYERILDLRDEYRRADRAVRAAALAGSCEPLEALRGATLLWRLRAISGANAALADAVRGVACDLD